MRGQTCFALFEDNRTILDFFIVTQRDGRIEGYAPVARSLFPRARQCNCSRRSHVGIVACRGYVGSQLRSAPPCSYSFCTGRGCRFVNVFSYNGFLLPHVRRRRDFLSRFQPYTSFDRNQPSAFFFASPLKPGTVFDATLLLFYFVPRSLDFPSTSNDSAFEILVFFWGAGKGLALSLHSPPPFSFGSHFSCLLCFPFSKFFPSLVFTLFLACLLIPSHLNFFSPLWLAFFCTPLSAKFNRTSLRDVKALHPSCMLQEVQDSIFLFYCDYVWYLNKKYHCFFNHISSISI